MKTETQITEVILEEQHQGLRTIIKTLATETECTDIFIYMGAEEYQNSCNIVICTNDVCIQTMEKFIKELTEAFEDEELEKLDDIDREDLSIIKQLFEEMKKVHYKSILQGLKINLEFGV